MAAAYYLDAVYVMLLDSARQADHMSSFSDEPTHLERDLKRSLLVGEVDGEIVDDYGFDPDEDGYDFSELPPPGEFIPGINDIREGPRSEGRADIIQLRAATDRINNGMVK